MTHFILCYVSFAAPQMLNSVNLQRSAGRHGPEFMYLKERKCSSVCITVSLYNQLPLSQGYILRCCINIYIARIPPIHVYAQKKSLRIRWIKTWMDDHRMLYSREEEVTWRQQSSSLCTASWRRKCNQAKDKGESHSKRQNFYLLLTSFRVQFPSRVMKRLQNHSAGRHL